MMERVWMGKASAVIGDACDIWIKHGLCHADGSARHFRSKAEIAHAAAEKGLTNHVEHRGSQGGDRSKWTQRWI